ncbi:Splicing factor U2AF 35 kDa subunit [Acipenser ruthenus]|uniref:Splicing factor U2AF 35 kDa subunit n=1 Tax=Acipenser ruthenus TaxID=7906 RepID=A0A444U6X9_ACIRT|nr:Splicing factor U2AF 35 kDa subunit [Acipenser ruthenus]
MAEYLASIFGTEKDKQWQFWEQTNAALKSVSSVSTTSLLSAHYPYLPKRGVECFLGSCQQSVWTGAVSDVEMQEHYDEFFEEVFTEMEEKYGEVEEMNVCDNLGDHLVGNVYVKFRREEDAEKAVMDLNNRWFNGQPIHAELSPVTDFREACCRQYEMGDRGDRGDRGGRGGRDRERRRSRDRERSGRF